MGSPLIEEFLAGDSKEIRDLANNEAVLVGFLNLVLEIDDLPDMEERFYEPTRSLYQATSPWASGDRLPASMRAFFGKAVKDGGKSLPVGLRFDPVVKYLGGIRKDQTLFIKKLKTGSFYGALWPWQADPKKVEVHLGFFSPSIRDADYQRLEGLVQKFRSQKKIETVSDIGGEIHGISLPSFLQMSEMEAATYTLRVTSDRRVGYLYLDGGSLIAARYDTLTGNAAAYRIISWEKASIQIQPAEPERAREIHEPLMHVMMESLKIKDETSVAEPSPLGFQPRGSSLSAMDTVSLDLAAEDEPTPSLEADEAPIPPSPRPSFSAPMEAEDPIVPFAWPSDHSAEREDRMGRTARRFIMLAGVALVATAVVAGAMWLKQRQIRHRYDRLIADLAVSKEMDAQIVLLMQYLKAHPADAHRAELEARLEAISAEMEKRDYEKTVLEVSQLPVDETFEKKALSIYTAFLTKYPQSAYAGQVHQAIGGIRQLLGSAYFEQLKKNSPADFLERYGAYKAYLDQFPDGDERKAIEQMIVELADAYADAIANQMTACDSQGNWGACIAECDRFLSVLSGQPSAQKVRQWRIEMVDKSELAGLVAEASQVSDEWEKAIKVYTDYLKRRPGTTQKAAIEAHIAEFNTKVEHKARWEKTEAFANDPGNDITERTQRLDRFIAGEDAGPYAAAARDLRERLESERQQALREQQRVDARLQTLARQQAQKERQEKELQRIRQLRDKVARQLGPVAGRFGDNGDGTVTDRVTGLTWCLLDSRVETGGCMDYQAAQVYVRNLNTGGYSDWRLPNAGELATIYKNAPFFPGGGAAWYWTSESFARGYHRVVDVVTTTPETVFTRVSKSETDCGAVRAVRR